MPGASSSTRSHSGAVHRSWTALTTWSAVASIVPGVGTALIWVPAAGYLLLVGRYTTFAIFVVYFIFVVGLIDNFLRPRLVGKGRALELLLTGRVIDAEEAFRIGLVNRVVPADRLISETEALLRAILENGPLAIRACLETVEADHDRAGHACNTRRADCSTISSPFRYASRGARHW